MVGGYFIFQDSYQQGAIIQTQSPLYVAAPGQELVPKIIPAADEIEEFLLEDEAASTVVEEVVATPDDQIQPEKITALLVKEISMVSGDLFFKPKVFTLIKDQPVKITFQNTGTHTFTINELDVNIRFNKSSAILEFTPSKSGTFEYYCAVPGHRKNGMFGSLTVKE